MVRIIVFVPSPDMLKPVQQQAAEWENDEISINVVHRFGTPEILYQLDNYDVIVARGITYNKICNIYPEKHITRLRFDGMDLVEALFQCRNTYHPHHIGLCLGRDRLQDLLPELEELSDARISLYDVQDEESARDAVNACLRDGTDAIVSGGTVSNLCRERNIPCTYIHMRMETVRQATLEAIKVAHSMNLERTKSHIIRTILNSSEDAVLALDEAGKLLEANDQAYRLYGLAFLSQWRGTPITDIRPDLSYIGSRTSPCKDGDEEVISINGQRYMVKYRLISGETSAIGTLNLERTKSHIIRTILNSSEDAVLALDEAGKLLEANDQAYRLYGLAFLSQWRGTPITDIRPDLSYIGSRTSPCKDGDEEVISINGQRYMVKYRLISGETSAIGTLITTSSASRILQEEQHIRKGLVRRGLTSKYTFRDIIAVSERMCSKVDMAKKFSRVNSNVLLTGETGTGKELFAHSIHAASARAEQPFVAVNCATLPENLLESELFGYEAGAFSGASREGKTGLFEQAHHGTIFLDEIGEIPVALQAKLLRVLQEKEVRRVGSTNVIPIDVRVISATNVNIQQQIQQGKFRSDLLYRLNTLEIHIPPLRERPEDILPLIEHQMRIIAAEQGTTPPELTPEAQELLKQYRWPGNVRELRNICERIVVMSSSRTVDQSTLMDLHIFRELPPEPAGQPASPSESLPVMLPQVIRKKDLAKELGVSRTTLWRMSKRLEQQKEQQT